MDLSHCPRTSSLLNSSSCCLSLFDFSDAYALTIAMREHRRRHQNTASAAPSTVLTEQQGAYCLSNDLFRDAQVRDPHIREWLTNGHGRISFTFVDMGQVGYHGERLLDIVPNPRHPLVSLIEQQQQQSHQSVHRPPTSYTTTY